MRQYLGDRGVYLIDMAHAKVAVQGVLPKAPYLHRQGIQKTHGLQPGLNLRLGHFFVVCKVAFHRHEPQQAEHQRHDDKQRQHRAPDALCKILHHGVHLSFYLKYR